MSQSGGIPDNSFGNHINVPINNAIILILTNFQLVHLEVVGCSLAVTSGSASHFNSFPSFRLSLTTFLAQ
jgi:hypothetical protein